MKAPASALVLCCAILAQAQQPSAHPAQMAIPNVKGVLEIDVGPTPFETHVRPDGKEVQLQAFGRPDKLAISAFLQRVEFPASPEKCRDEWWPGTKKAVKMQREDLQETVVKDGIARVEFIVPEFQGLKVQQKDMHAYLGSGNLCAEIHLSKVGFRPEDSKLFEDVLASVKLSPDLSRAEAQAENPGQSEDHDSSYYFALGSKFYLQQNYSQAEDAYLKALDLNRQKRTLSKDYFRVLVNNLGMSYGITGKLQLAEATFVFGLTQDPEYPMFYYNLPCTYGEMDKMNDALTQLRLFYKYKANMIAGETLPDPLKDDSFRKFVSQEEFVKAVREMQK
jgi:tetratricopeptide (TPR) repeat protein